jgi:hypothetical protein
MSKGTRRKKGETSTPESAVAPAVVDSSAELKAAFDNVRTQIDGIDSKLKTISDKITPMDLKMIEDKIALTLEKLNGANNSLTNIEKDVHNLVIYAMTFLGLGGLGIVVFTYYALKALRVI